MSATLPALFVIGGRMLTVGRGYSEGQWRGAFLTTLIAFGATIVVLPLLAVASDSVFDTERKGSAFDRGTRTVIAVIATAASVYIAARGAREGATFVKNAMGLDSPSLLTAAVLLSVGAFISVSGRGAIRKLALVSVAFSLVSSAALLILAIGRGGMSFRSLGWIVSRDALAESVDGGSIVAALASVFAPCIISVMWLSASGGGKRPQRSATRSAFGVAVGGTVLLLSFLTVALTIGLPYASGLEYPYVSAVGSMTAGKLFMRPEGVVYLSYLSVLVTGIAVCLSLVGALIKDKRKRAVPFAAAAVAFALCLFIR